MADPLEHASDQVPARRDDAPVLIVGGGPVGLSLALGLAHHGVRSLVVEQDTTTPLGSKAFGVWGRTLEIFEDWGVASAFLERGDQRWAISPANALTEKPIFTVDFSLLADESAMPGIVLLPQAQTEMALREQILEQPLAEVVLGECVAAKQSGTHVEITVRGQTGERTFTGQYLVGADGSRSMVRESLGLRHEGSILNIGLLVFDVDVDDAGLQPIRLDPKRKGLVAALRFAPGQWRVLASLPSGPPRAPALTEGPPPRAPDLPLEELEPQIRALFGDREHRVTWQSQTTLYQQRMQSFRHGRIVFAGDSAHLISPAGGQGMNQGIQDAENLAWSLAAVLSGADPDTMLDGYDEERQHAADVVSRRAFINSQLEFRTPTWLRPLAFAGMRFILRIRPVVRRMVRRLSMRDLRYRGRHSARLLKGHRAVGRRVPDVVLPSGERLANRLRGKAAVVSVGTTVLAGVPAGVSVVRLESTPEGLGLRRGSVAIVRPDRHVAAVLRRPGQEQLAKALKDGCGVA